MGEPGEEDNVVKFEEQLAALRGAVDQAEPVAASPDAQVLEPDVDRDYVPVDDGRGDGGGDGSHDDGRRADGLPIGCPVVPLGKEKNIHFYLDALKQLIELSSRDHSRNNLSALFAPYQERLRDDGWWPSKKLIKSKGPNNEVIEEWITVGFKVEHCADDLMMSCAKKGVWRPQGKLRGAGAWLAENGRLLYHCGHTLWSLDDEGEPMIRDTGVEDGYIYPAFPSLPQPSVTEQGTDAGKEVLSYLQTWNWLRQERHKNVDATLMLGWIGAAMVGGALDWRPMAFLTGDRGTGKSTLMKQVKWLFDSGLIETADTTEAGIAQHLGYSTIPVAVDELEADGDNRRQQSVIKLARISSSGGTRRRGSSSHQSTEFTAQSCFLFSAILMPPLETQDRSRMAILRLNPLRKGAMLPPQEPALWKKLGRQIKRRMADAWPRFADTILLYRQMLVDAGHDARGAEQFSALLACADLMLHDEVPDRDTLDEWGKVFEADRWRESVEQSSNAQKCLDWLAQSQPEIYRGGSKQTVAEAVRALIKMREQDAATDQDKKPYRELLAAGGLSLVFRREDRTMVLAVSVAHRQTVKLFEGTIWSVGAGASGGWVEALTRLEGVERNKRSKIAGRTEACVHVPIHLVLAEDPPEPEPAT